MDRSEVETWLDAVQSDLKRVSALIEPLMAEQARLRARETLLLQLLQSFDGALTAPEAAAVPAVVPVDARPPGSDGSVGDRVRSRTIEILRTHDGGPMHINDIHKNFLARGFAVPGAGRPANLTAHLGRCDGIVSPSRGFYALGETSKLGARRTRRPKRR